MHHVHISDKDFAQIVAEALDALPPKFAAHMNNVLVTYDADPTPDQRRQLALRGDQTLFGLYEGVPLTARGSYAFELPDKITIFKNPLLQATRTLDELKEQVRHTLWHEVAHHFGLDHARIDELDQKRAAR